MKIVALDLSLTRSGFATSEDYSGVLRPPKGYDAGMLRLGWIREAVLAIAEDADLVVVEGYSYGSKGRAVVNIGELGGVIRLAFYDAGIPYVEVPPSSLKRFATGKGNADKDSVLAAAIRRLDYDGHYHDEADALFLLEMARTHYDLPCTPMPKAHIDALDGVRWPELTVNA